MNTITVQISERQYRSMMELLDYALERIEGEQQYPTSDEVSDQAEKMLAEHEELVQELTSTKSYLWNAGCIDLSLEIPAQAVDDIAQPGDNEPAVKAWRSEPSYLKAQLDSLDIEDIQEYLSEAGIEDVGSKFNHELKDCVLWMACHDIAEERNQED